MVLLRNTSSKCSRDSEPSESRLLEIGRKLGWRQGSTTPPMAFLARKVNRQKEYDFVYQGSSRYVHFSTSEIMRRVWGNQGHVEIGSDTFSPFWQDFAVYWSFYILINLIVSYGDILPSRSVPDETAQRLKAALDKILPVPIITRRELDWP